MLLLIDGHDEYKTGRNIDIDEAIKKESLWNCWMLLTSRETEQIKDIKEFMDAEAEIKGFDEINVEAYITRSLGSEEKTKDLLKQARNCKLIGSWDYGILAIPILLNMVCVLFKCNKSLPSTRTGIAQAIVDRCIDREAIRAKGQKAVDSAKQALYNLGKLAWQGLNEPGMKLVFDKVSQEILFYVLSFTRCLFIKLLKLTKMIYFQEEVIRVAGEEALELGLLFGTENLTPQEEETDVLCFAHLMLQEFTAGIFIGEQDKVGCLVKNV